MNNSEIASNPAGRLHDIVHKAKQREGQKVHPHLADLLYGPASRGELTSLRAVAAIIDLTDEVERLIRTIPTINASKHLAWLPKAREGFRHFDLRSGTPMPTFFSGFDESAMALLSICSDHIQSHHPEPVVDDKTAVKLLIDALALHKSILNSNIEAYIREFLLRNVQIIIDALYDYRTKGFQALWVGLTATKGHFDYRHYLRGVSDDGIKNTGLLTQLLALYASLSTAVQVAQNSEYLFDKSRAAVKLLESPDSVAVAPAHDVASPSP